MAVGVPLATSLNVGKKKFDDAVSAVIVEEPPPEAPRRGPLGLLWYRPSYEVHWLNR